jgi:RNA polymerase sigma-70 factor (ECF subfamily)
VAVSAEPEASVALQDLADSYWYPAYAFFRAHGAEPELAAAQIEAVLTRLISEPPNFLAIEPPPSFRETLLTISRETLAEPELRPASIEIDRVWAEQRFAREPPKKPEEVFARRWTLTILEYTLGLLDAEYTDSGRAAVFQELRPFLGYSSAGEDAYLKAGERLGISESAARTGVFELRKRYRELLHAQIADTVAREELTDAEHMTLLAGL